MSASEVAPCPLQPCYFNKWDIFADSSDCQYAMGFPVCIFNNLLPIFSISCHLLMSKRDGPIFEKLFFPKIWIPLYLYFSVFLSYLVCNNLIIILFFMPPTQASILHSYNSVVLTSWYTTTTTIVSCAHGSGATGGTPSGHLQCHR